MRGMLVFICILLLIASVVAASAASPPASVKPTDGEKRVSLKLKDVPLAQALEKLFKDQHLNYVLEPMPNTPKVSLSIENTTFQEALRLIADASGAYVRRVNGMYHIGPTPQNPYLQMQADLMTEINEMKAQLEEKRKTLPEDCSEIRSLRATLANREQTLASLSSPGRPLEEIARVTLQLKDTPLSQALDALFKDRPFNYVLEPMPNPPTVTAVVNDVPWNDAFQTVLRATGLTARRENNVYYISRAKMPGTDANSAIIRVLEDEYAKLSESLSQMLSARRSDDPSIVGTREEMQSIEEKLREYRNPPAGAQPVQAYVVNGSAGEAVQLRYLAPTDLTAAIMNIEGMNSVAVVGTNKLFLNGDEIAIKEAKTLIAKLDDESALPLPVHIILELSVTVSTGAGKPSVCKMASDGAGMMGSSIPISLIVAPAKANGSAVLGGFETELTPSLSADNGIILKSEGAFQCTVGRQEVKQDLESSRRIQPGQPTVIGYGEYTIEGQSVKYEVMATVTVNGQPTKKLPPAKMPQVRSTPAHK